MTKNSDMPGVFLRARVVWRQMQHSRIKILFPAAVEYSLSSLQIDVLCTVFCGKSYMIFGTGRAYCQKNADEVMTQGSVQLFLSSLYEIFGSLLKGQLTQRVLKSTQQEAFSYIYCSISVRLKVHREKLNILNRFDYFFFNKIT